MKRLTRHEFQKQIILLGEATLKNKIEKLEEEYREIQGCFTPSGKIPRVSKQKQR